MMRVPYRCSLGHWMTASTDYFDAAVYVLTHGHPTELW